MIKYAAIDIETTGLNPREDRILEIALLLLDEDLDTRTDKCWRIRQPPQVLERMNDYVRCMHTRTGLVCDNRVVKGYDAALVETELTYLLTHPKPLVLAGQGVHFDRAFLKHWMPLAEAKLHYRHIDTQTLMLLAPDVDWPMLRENLVHSGRPDISCAVERLRMARKMLTQYDGLWDIVR